MEVLTAVLHNQVTVELSWKVFIDARTVALGEV